MNLRHAATLALVGWYLMKPPLYIPWTDRVRQLLGYPSENWEYDRDAPISQWSQVGEFDSLAACHADEEGLCRLASVSSSANPPSPLTTASCVCIATDDPRLKN